MATRFYSLNRGQHRDQVATATVAPTADVYIAIDLSKTTTKADVRILAQEILDHMYGQTDGPLT